VTRIASINGVITAPERAVVSIYDRGFLYADGVFETMRAYGGRVFAIADHLTRLAKSAAALRMTLPIAPEELAREVVVALAASGEAEAVVRLMVTRGAPAEPSLVPRQEARGTRVVLVEPLTPFARATYADGLRVITLAWPRDESPAAIAKQLAYVTSFLALHEARARGADDAIFVEGPQVREAATANVFVVRDDGVLATPLDGPGVLGGITRSHVVDLASSLGISCSISSVATTEMGRAREVFLTSSVREIAPVVAIDGKAVGAGTPGEITRAVHRAYRARIGAPGPPPWE
jgi:branched-chain amino acid aminotransferase